MSAYPRDKCEGPRSNHRPCCVPLMQLHRENGAARLLTAHFDRLLSAAWQRTSSRQHKPATDVHPDVYRR